MQERACLERAVFSEKEVFLPEKWPKIRRIQAMKMNQTSFPANHMKAV
jgi:hypothetical protein